MSSANEQFGQNNLEFELRLQQYIELLRERRIIEAKQHAQKYFSQQIETHLAEIYRASGLLAVPPDTQAEPYKVDILPFLPKFYFFDSA